MAAGDQRKRSHLSKVGADSLVLCTSWLLRQELTWPRSRPSGSRDQATALRAEGVTVTTGALGELMVDLVEFGWFPVELPSEAGQDDELTDEEGEDGRA